MVEYNIAAFGFGDTAFANALEKHLPDDERRSSTLELLKDVANNNSTE